MRELTPREIVTELNRHIVGQDAAKRAVAVAVRNRWRRQHVADDMRQEVAPKNIMMIGPTGVGKTEIARRLAKLTGAPFIKVEATRYTEVGYYGRDVESMVRELVENAIGLVREQEKESVKEEAQRRAEERLLDLLAPAPPPPDEAAVEGPDSPERHKRTREKMRAMLTEGKLDDRRVEMTVEQKAVPMMFTGVGMEQMDVDLQGMLEKIVPRHTSRRELTVREARKVIFEQESDALINAEKVNGSAIDLAENLGIIFVDEIDKVVASESGHGADVSRQGVQRDLLPIVEGTTVQTRYGYVKTDHILFIAAGAFHRAKPSDLMPELQGRFPIRVELGDLGRDDFIRILTEPRGALTKQYQALLGTEECELVFTADAIESLAEYAFQVNQRTQNIGARRLNTIMERLLEELSFEAPEMGKSRVEINAAYVKERLDQITHDEDMSKFNIIGAVMDNEPEKPEEIKPERPAPEKWPDGFFDAIHVEDPNFTRPDQGEMPPIVTLDLADGNDSLFARAPWRPSDAVIGVFVSLLLAGSVFLSSSLKLHVASIPLFVLLTLAVQFIFLLGIPLWLLRRRAAGLTVNRPRPSAVAREFLLAIPLAIGVFLACIAAAWIWRGLLAVLGLPIDSPQEFWGRMGPRRVMALLALAVTAAPIVEEIFFRGFLGNALRRVLPGGIAVFAQALLFGLGHTYEPGGVAIAFTIGLLLALIYQWRRTLITTMFVHGLYNAFIGLIVVGIMVASAKMPVIGITPSPDANDRVVIDKVLPGSPAEDADLQPGDVVAAYNGTPVKDFKELTKLIRGGQIGDRARIEIVRDGRHIEKYAVLGRRPDEG